MSQHHLKLTLLASIILSLNACVPEAPPAATETLQTQDWRESVKVQGEVVAANKTVLNVPGEGWDSRILISMVAEGSKVKRGQVVARFDAPASRLEAQQSAYELQRKQLAEQSLLARDSNVRFGLSAEQAKTQSDLRLSQRYLNSDTSMFSRNKVLDELQDTGLLQHRQNFLSWRENQLQQRKNLDLAVLNSQRQTIEVKAERARRNLDALDLIAPHDGVFVLHTQWDGSKAKVGSNYQPQQEFAEIPDTQNLVASFMIEENRSFGLQIGMPILVNQAGSNTVMELNISKISQSASEISRESPVKFIKLEAQIKADLAHRFQLTPGQALFGEIIVANKKQVLTVPNIAIKNNQQNYQVMVQQGAAFSAKTVQLGLRGQARTEVREGLQAGMKILLTPVSSKTEPQT